MISVFERREDCCGCTACEFICPTNAIGIISDKEGFLYPKIDQELCIDCGLCVETCAFQKGYDTTDNYKVPKVFALKHKSDGVREKSSSGGAFTAISDYILSIDGIIYGAILDSDMKVFHLRTETSEDRNKLRGSKYVQSDMKDVFTQVKIDLLNNKPVLFVGTPCQVAGIKRYLIKSKVNTDRLLLVDFICHGTPSPLIFKEYITYVEKKKESKVTQYYFRSKVKGWGHTEEAFFENGKRDSTSILSQLHRKLFHSNLCLRPSCFKCRYTNINRPSDITMADFWGIEKCLPKFKDYLGVSAVLVNTKKGSDVYAHVTDSADTILSCIDDCAYKQLHLKEPSSVNPNREAFWKDYDKHGFEYVAKKYAEYNAKGRIKHLLKRVLRL